MGEHTWLKWPLLAAAFLFPFTVVSVPDGGSGTYVLPALFGVFLAWPAWRHLAPEERRVLLGILAFYLVVLLTLINTENYSLALDKFDRYTRVLLMIPVYVLIRRVGIVPGRAFLYGCVVAGFTLAAHGWYQVHVQGMSDAAGIYHKIVFGDAAVEFAAILVIAMLTLARRPWQYALLGLSTAAALYASVLSVTRSSWLFVIVFAVALLWWYRRELGRRGWAAVGAGLVLLIAVGAIWQPRTIIHGVERGIQNLKTYEVKPGAPTSWGIRLNLWHDALLLFAEHPILGTGVGDFDVERNRLIAEGRARDLPSFGHAHNQYFHSLATTGLVGLIALLVCLFYLPARFFVGAWHRASTDWGRFYALAGLSVLLAFGVFGVAETWLARMPFANLFGFPLLVLLASAAAETGAAPGSGARPPGDSAA
ncbi:MAG: O-antigen ligase family protein [Gammaproteobacteria bacterium]